MEFIIPMLIIALVAVLRSIIHREEQPDELNLEDKFQYAFSPSTEWVSTILPYGQVVAFAPDNAISMTP